jgi:hypothetical protein
MKCRKARNLIYELLDNVLSDSERLHLESHMRECRSCENLSLQLQKSLDLLHDLPQVEPGENFNWKVRLKLAQEKHSLQEELSTHTTWVKRWNFRFALGTVASLAAVLAGGYLFLNSFAPGQVSIPAGVTASQPVLSPSERSVADAGREMAGYSNQFYSSPGFGERLVAQGSPAQSGTPQSFHAIDEDGASVVLGPDSLVVSKLRDLRQQYKVRYLERQIELLQDYLRQCQVEQK